MKRILITLLLHSMLFHAYAAQTDTNATAVEKKLTDEELMDRVLYTNLIGAGVVTLWGIAFWDYFSTTPQLGHEKWFGRDTKYGGADKMGHMYSTYLWSLGFTSLYEYWGMKNSDAALYGSLTSLTFQTIMELGDSFS